MPVTGHLFAGLATGVSVEKLHGQSLTPGKSAITVSVAFFSSLFHDLLDFFHSSDRMPFWPFYSVRSGFGFQRFFASTYKEFLFYAVLYCLFLLLLYIRQGKQAYLKLGKTGAAEKLLLKSFGENPDYFWCVLDLAKFYASSELPVSDRRRLSWPYVERLKSELSGREGINVFL